jgi:hypothetical protein
MKKIIVIYMPDEIPESMGFKNNTYIYEVFVENEKGKKNELIGIGNHDDGGITVLDLFWNGNGYGVKGIKALYNRKEFKNNMEVIDEIYGS